jgi:hypothetical protein
MAWCQAFSERACSWEPWRYSGFGVPGEIAVKVLLDVLQVAEDAKPPRITTPTAAIS